MTLKEVVERRLTEIGWQCEPMWPISINDPDWFKSYDWGYTYYDPAQHKRDRFSINLHESGIYLSKPFDYDYQNWSNFKDFFQLEEWIKNFFGKSL